MQQRGNLSRLLLRGFVRATWTSRRGRRTNPTRTKSRLMSQWQVFLCAGQDQGMLLRCSSPTNYCPEHDLRLRQVRPSMSYVPTAHGKKALDSRQDTEGWRGGRGIH